MTESYKPKENSITSDLRRDIQSGLFEEGQLLLLKDLQQAFRASWMPVHNSVKTLVEEGLVIREGTGMSGTVTRYFANPPKPEA